MISISMHSRKSAVWAFEGLLKLKHCRYFCQWATEVYLWMKKPL